MASNYDDVLSQLEAVGLQVDHLVADGRVKRCKVEGDREKRGWYKLHEMPIDGGEVLIVGTFGVWRGDDAGTIKVELKKRELTKEQREALKRRLAEDRKLAEADQARAQAKAAAHAASAWRKCSTEGESDYLTRKQVQPHGVRFSPQGAVVVPMMDLNGQVHGLQFILSRSTHGKRIEKTGRDKEFWPTGLAKRGHFHLIGASPSSVVLVAEGYATAASLHQATGLPVAVAFDAGNLLPVGEALVKRYKVKALFCADDDSFGKCIECSAPVKVADPVCPACGKEHKRTNAGVTRASEAAFATAGAWIAPAFADDEARWAKYSANWNKITDFNDLHVIEGLPLVRAQIEARIDELGWRRKSEPARVTETKGGGEGEAVVARAIMTLDEIVERFVLIDDGTGDHLFDTWTRRIVKSKQAVVLLPAGVRWDDVKRHPRWMARAYFLHQVGFDPTGKDNGVKLNTWRGWPMQPKEGDCTQLLELIDYLCSGEGDERGRQIAHWLKCWMAYPLQHPGAKMQSAVVMHGPQGTGKSTIFQALAKIYGEYATVLNQRGLEDKFNSDWADSKLFLLAEEVVTRAEMYHIKNELKELVTGDVVRVNPKNVAAYKQKNQINLAFLSNENQPLPLENDDRRHLVVWTPPMLSPDYYDGVRAEMANGGVEAFYQYLLSYDVGDFKPWTRPPATRAKTNLIALSLPSDQRFLREWSEGDTGLPVCPCLRADLYSAYLSWCRKNGESKPRPSKDFYAQIRAIPGWDVGDTKQRAMLGGDKAEPARIVIPAAEILMMWETGRPDSCQPPVWLGESIDKFKKALNPAGSEAYV